MSYSAMMKHRQTGQQKFKQGQYDDAKRFFQLALEETNSYRLPNAYTAQQLRTLGVFHFALGEYRKAEPYFKKALAVEQGLVESENMSIAKGFNSLGLLYQVWGKYADAERAFKQAMAYKERSQLLSHRQNNSKLLKMSRNHLAMLFCAQSKRDDALKLCEQTYAKNAKAGALDFPSDLHDLAMRYCKNDCATEAKRTCAWLLEYACEELQREYLGACTPEISLGKRGARPSTGAPAPAYGGPGYDDEVWRPSAVGRSGGELLTRFNRVGDALQDCGDSFTTGLDFGWRSPDPATAKRN